MRLIEPYHPRKTMACTDQVDRKINFELTSDEETRLLEHGLLIWCEECPINGNKSCYHLGNPDELLDVLYYLTVGRP